MKRSMRDPNFITPRRWPVATAIPARQATDDPPRQHPDDLPAHHRLGAVLDPDLAPLVLGRGLAAVGWQEAAGGAVHAGDRAADGNTVHVDVEGRQEYANLLPRAARRHTGLGRAGEDDPAVGRRHDGAGNRGHAPLGVSEEEPEEKPAATAATVAQGTSPNAMQAAPQSSAPAMNGIPAWSILMLSRRPCTSRRHPAAGQDAAASGVRAVNCAREAAAPSRRAGPRVGAGSPPSDP